MYTGKGLSVEDICFEQRHIDEVLARIKVNFDSVFKEYIETHAGKDVSDIDFSKLQKKFGVKAEKKSPAKNLSANYKEIIREAIDDFEHDRDAYKKIMNLEVLEDYDEDASTFKSKVLRNECPIIRKTIANTKAKELDKYRASFNHADPEWLLQIVTRLCEFGESYYEKYDQTKYENIAKYEELQLQLLDTEDYTAFGVIGGGIKTHILYKIYPGLFPNRSRNAIWAFWYLTDKKAFGCKTDSEFLMIDIKKTITQQNYFYPYELFAYYAFEIYKMLRDKAEDLSAYIDTDYRYVLVDSFLDFVAMKHDNEISFLKSQIKDGGMGYV